MTASILVVFILSSALLFWMFAGYPLALFLLSKICSRPVNQQPHFPQVSVVVCTYNEARVIERRLSNLLELDYPLDKLEILVVDSASKDGTVSFVNRFCIAHPDAPIRLIREDARRGKVSAINLGLACASGEVVILTDGPTVFAQDTIKLVMQNFADLSVGAVTGNFVKYDLEGEIASQETEWVVFNFRKFLRRLEAIVDSTTWLSGELTAFRRNLIPAIPSSVIIDDAYIAMAIREQGYRVVVDERAIYTEKRPARYAETVTIKKKSVVGSVQEMVRFRKMLFNLGYHWYGVLVLPAKLLHFYLNPFILLSMLISGLWLAWLYIGAVPLLTAIGGSLFLLLLLGLYRRGKMLRPLVAFGLMEWIIITGLLQYATGDYSAAWEQVKSTRDGPIRG
jgi:cellulose synthase/poly-beta-1,6-N-acetylglucosamine synthase-like glycosyltransferase